MTLVPSCKWIPQYNRKKIAKPGDSDIQFENDVEGVLEVPYAQADWGKIKSPLVIPPIDNSLEGITVYGNQSPSPYLTSAPTILPPTIQDIQEAEQYKASQKDKMATALDVPVDYNEVQRKLVRKYRKIMLIVITSVYKSYKSLRRLEYGKYSYCIRCICTR